MSRGGAGRERDRDRETEDRDRIPDAGLELMNREIMT